MSERWVDGIQAEGETPHGAEVNPTGEWLKHLKEILDSRNQEPSSDGEGSDHLHIHHLDNKPILPVEHYLGDDGKEYVSFGKKFSPDFKGWEFGDRITSRFIVQNRDGEIHLLVADSVVGDIRHSDVFILVGLSEAEKTALLTVGMAEVEADVKVLSEGENIASNMYEYQVELIKVVGVQEPFNLS